MKCKWSHVDLGFRLGTIWDMSVEAIEIAKLLDTRVSFIFNGVRVNVSAKSTQELVSKLALDAVCEGTPGVFGEGC